jgi:hypothetical protein
LLAVEKTPMKRSNGACADTGLDFNSSRSTICSESSDVGRPLARIDSNFISPEIFISLTSHGSRVWIITSKVNQQSKTYKYNDSIYNIIKNKKKSKRERKYFTKSK